MSNTNRIIRYFFLFIIIISVSSCTALKKTRTNAKIRNTLEKNSVFSGHHVGMFIKDAETNEILLNINESKYFVPASNTKILTLAAYLSTNLDSIPSFYIYEDQSLKSLGDPTFLHPDFEHQPAFAKIQEIDKDTLFITSDFKSDKYGPGWAWDDFSYYFQPERSGLPVYGNVLKAKKNDTKFEIVPKFFEEFVELSNRNGRAGDYNFFFLDKSEKDSTEIDIPFSLNDELIEILLADTLSKFVHFNKKYPLGNKNIIYNQPSLPVLALMMQRSDNFLAEQLLINAQLTEGFQYTKSYINKLNQSVFADLSNPLIWVDGSGLSRYNMVTPKSLVEVLSLIKDKLTWEEISYVFPTGGVSGTIKNWYISDEPYVFAKTGTLRHNHNLSGFLKTRSGRILIFSFMNNNYSFRSSSVVKREMENILTLIRENY